MEENQDEKENPKPTDPGVKGDCICRILGLDMVSLEEALQSLAF